MAVSVIAIALPALTMSMMNQIDGSAHMRDKLQAQWVAENKLTEIRIRNRLQGKVPIASEFGEEEMVGRKWKWEINSKAFPQKELADVFGIEVRVWAEEVGEDVFEDEEPIIKLVGVLQKHKKEAIIRPAAEQYSSDTNNSDDAQEGGTND